MSPRVSRKLHDRNEKLSPAIRDIAPEGPAPVVLALSPSCHSEQAKVRASTAITREMIGFIRPIARFPQPALES